VPLASCDFRSWGDSVVKPIWVGAVCGLRRELDFGLRRVLRAERDIFLFFVVF